jgi:putative tryptophan/tyrosine transport system substrate-binding protein
MASHIERRKFLATLLGGAAVWPVAARAQPAERMRRIGVLAGLAEDDPDLQAQLAAFRRELDRLGWSQERNVRIDFRSARANVDQMQALAKELIALQPDVILAHTTPVVAALQRETRAVPIVFVYVADPIASRLVASLARPGGNITGLLNYEASITGKWLAMLREIAPRMTRAALVGDPKTPTYDYWLRTAKAVAPSLAIELVSSPVQTDADIERAIESFAQAPNGGLFLPPNNTTYLHRDRIIALAAHHRLPAVYAFRIFVAAGGLMSYGTDGVDHVRQAASYVDRILRGANPADLPVQAPTRYETAINLKTAKALGLTVPNALLVAADEVIE